VEATQKTLAEVQRPPAAESSDDEIYVNEGGLPTLGLPTMTPRLDEPDSDYESEEEVLHQSAHIALVASQLGASDELEECCACVVEEPDD